MKVILDGWDGTGKSTLAREVGRRLGWPVQWLGQSPVRDPYAWYALGMDRHADEVLDRSWWSIAVYGELVRGRREILPAELFYLELMTWDALLVRCQCSRGLVEERIAREGDGHPAEMALEPGPGMELFERTMRASRLPRDQYLVMDTTPSGDRAALVRGDVSRVCESNLEVNVQWLEDTVRAATPGPKLRGVGCTRGPRVALVGEGSPYGDPPWHRGGAAAYLLRALLTVQPRLTTDDVYLTNASHPDLAEELWRVQPRAVVPLGRRARERVARIGLRCRGVEHPQWWRRFKSGEEEAYGSRIAELAEL